jgi:hypothetical protein
VTKVETKEILKAEYVEAKLGKLAENLWTAAYKNLKDMTASLTEKQNPPRELHTARLIRLINNIRSNQGSPVVLTFLKGALFSEVVAVPALILEKIELLRKSISLLEKVSRIITPLGTRSGRASGFLQ